MSRQQWLTKVTRSKAPCSYLPILLIVIMLSPVRGFFVPRRLPWGAVHFGSPTMSRTASVASRLIATSVQSSATATTQTQIQNRTFHNNLISQPSLSALVDIGSDYSLAPTPEDHLPLEEGQRLVCIGDIHGSYAALEESLKLAGVLDTSSPEPQWSGGNTIVVQTGDITDRGSQELKSYKLLCNLSHQAVKAGGKVILLLGNHEILNIEGEFSYAARDKDLETQIAPMVDQQLPQFPNWRLQFGDFFPERLACYEPGGLLAGPLLSQMKLAVRVGGTVCVHAGLLPEHLLEYGGISGLNQIVREWILGKTQSGHDILSYYHEGFDHTGPLRNTALWQRLTTIQMTEPRFLSSHDSMVWTRKYSSPPDTSPRAKGADELLEEALKKVDESCERMVVGHTIQSEINAQVQDKIWRIDIGAGFRDPSQAQVLEIQKLQGRETVQILGDATAPEAPRRAGMI